MQGDQESFQSPRVTGLLRSYSDLRDAGWYNYCQPEDTSGRSPSPPGTQTAPKQLFSRSAFLPIGSVHEGYPAIHDRYSGPPPSDL